MERRQESEDRRKIERFSNPPVRSHFSQTQIFINFLTVLSFSAGVYHVVRGFYLGRPETAIMGVFLGSMSFMITVFLYRYATALKEYLKNESLGNLDRSMETQSALWFVISFLALVYTIIYFIFG